MSAAANAAGYLYAAGILGRRKQERALDERAVREVAEIVGGGGCSIHPTSVEIPVRQIPVTYRKRRS